VYYHYYLLTITNSQNVTCGQAGTRKVKPIWILLEQETVSGSGISWATCKSASRSRQITTPAPHHSSFFTGRMPFLSPNQHCQSTDGITYNNERNSLRLPEFHHLMLQNSNTFKAIWICLWQVFCADVARNKTFLGDYITQ